MSKLFSSFGSVQELVIDVDTLLAKESGTENLYLHLKSFAIETTEVTS